MERTERMQSMSNECGVNRSFCCRSNMTRRSLPLLLLLLVAAAAESGLHSRSLSHLCALCGSNLSVEGAEDRTEQRRLVVFRTRPPLPNPSRDEKQTSPPAAD